MCSKKIFIVAIILALFSAFQSCSRNDDNVSVSPESQDKIPFIGAYSWSFEIPNMGTQKSTHIFDKDKIHYKMTGDVYNIQYVQLFQHYNPNEKRLITIGEGNAKDGVYFVMFFKDITENSMKIYKHECKKKGEEGRKEAENFPYPADDATADHGWNIYVKE